MDPPPKDPALSGLASELEGTKYRFVRRLGRGGMGEICEVEHIALGHRLAMKLLLAHYADDAGLGDRLRVEAQVTTALDSPHVLQVLDLGRTRSGRPYLVTELLRGETLREVLSRDGPLPARQAIDYIGQSLDGLQQVHQAGLVHRDIKPSNLFVCEPDRSGRCTVKVIDLGVVKVRRDNKSRAPIYQTAQGALIGTPSYASPEQLRREPVDARSDLYAMGLVLYRLLTGRGPFVERDLVELVKAHTEQPPPPPSRFAAQPISAALDAVVLKALEKKPADRYQSAAEMAAALRALQHGSDQSDEPAPEGTETIPSLPDVFQQGMGPPQPLATRHQARLEVVSGPDQGRTFVIRTSAITVGRSARADFSLTDPTVADFHALFLFDRAFETWGVFRNDETEGVELADGRRPSLAGQVRHGETVTLLGTQTQLVLLTGGPGTKQAGAKCP